MKSLYTTTVHTTGGREGRAVSDDGQLDIALSMPKAIGGSGAGGNPEQLFAAGFAACFDSSLRYAAKTRNLDPGEVAVDATVSLIVNEDGAYCIAARLLVTLPRLDSEQRAAVVEEAKRICAYSNATRGNIDMTVDLV